MKHIVLSIVFVILISVRLSLAQDNRLVVVSYNDSTVHAGIFTHASKIKPDNEKVYYWYMSDQINSNRGGFSGYLLDGDYLVYNNSNHLITYGLFSKGLMTGAWKRWDANGQLLEIVNWKEGRKNGIAVLYGPDGTVKSTMKYNKGKPKVKKIREPKAKWGLCFKRIGDQVSPADSVVADKRTKRQEKTIQ